MISSSISLIHQGIILIIIVLHQRCLNCLNASRDTLHVLYMQLQHQVQPCCTVLLSIFYTNDPTGSSADCSLFILSLHALALHLAVVSLLQIFLYEDLSTLISHTPESRLGLPECQQTALCYATNTIK